MDRHLPPPGKVVPRAEALVHKLVQSEPSPQEHSGLAVLRVHHVLSVERSCTAKVSSLLTSARHIEGNQPLGGGGGGRGGRGGGGDNSGGPPPQCSWLTDELAWFSSTSMTLRTTIFLYMLSTVSSLSWGRCHHVNTHTHTHTHARTHTHTHKHTYLSNSQGDPH